MVRQRGNSYLGKSGVTGRAGVLLEQIILESVKLCHAWPFLTLSINTANPVFGSNIIHCLINEFKM